MLDLASSTVASALRGLAVAAGLDPLVVVVDGDREGLLGLVLTDDVAVEEVVDLARLRQLVEAELAGLGELLLDDLVAQVDALVADVDARAGDQLLDLLLALSAEGALEQVAGLADSCHERFVPLCSLRSNAHLAGPDAQIPNGTRNCQGSPLQSARPAWRRACAGRQRRLCP